MVLENKMRRHAWRDKQMNVTEIRYKSGDWIKLLEVRRPVLEFNVHVNEHMNV
jgi:hypothetical protein